MRYDLVRRFFAKLIHDVLPAALASLIGGFLLTHYGIGRVPAPAPVSAAPASAEMMDLLRDEHALVVSYLNTKIAAEKQQALLAKSAPEPTAADGGANDQASALRLQPAAAKSATLRNKAGVVGASLPPLVIARESVDSPPPHARADNSLFTKVIADRVLAATQRAVSVIGGIPSWFGSLGDRIGGAGENPRPPAELVSAS